MFQNAIKKHNDKLEGLRKFIFLVVGYGLMINFILFILAGSRFGVDTILAYGFIYFLIKEEFVEWFVKLFHKYKR